MKNPAFQLILFLVVVVGGGWAIGAANLPGSWYAALNKPSFNPPNWLFPPVWTVLYVMIAVAGWRTFRQEPRGPAMTLWVNQLLFNFLWSPVFFTAHNMVLGLGVISALLLFVLAFIWLRWQRDRVAALLFCPYAAWVAFATALNAAIYRLN
jgi:benzodiazapine receptor